jgi:hypothetical protein
LQSLAGKLTEQTDDPLEQLRRRLRRYTQRLLWLAWVEHRSCGSRSKSFWRDSSAQRVLSAWAREKEIKLNKSDPAPLSLDLTNVEFKYGKIASKKDMQATLRFGQKFSAPPPPMPPPPSLMEAFDAAAKAATGMDVVLAVDQHDDEAAAAPPPLTEAFDAAAMTSEEDEIGGILAETTAAAAPAAGEKGNGKTSPLPAAAAAAAAAAALMAGKGLEVEPLSLPLSRRLFLRFISLFSLFSLFSLSLFGFSLTVSPFLSVAVSLSFLPTLSLSLSRALSLSSV